MNGISLAAHERFNSYCLGRFGICGGDLVMVQDHILTVFILNSLDDIVLLKLLFRFFY